MIQSQRFQKIEERANERGIVNTREMAALLGVTETTIRRDFEELERTGKIVRVHGGARSLKKKQIVTMGDELEIGKRTAHAKEKDDLSLTGREVTGMSGRRLLGRAGQAAL